MSKHFLNHQTIEDNRHLGDYRVEAIDQEGDGEIFTAIFTGPDAGARAHEYADWKNSSQQPLAKAS
jgi:hypothetical protein